MAIKVGSKSNPLFNGDRFISGKANSVTPATATWGCSFAEPTQSDIAVDGTLLYFAMNDANPNVSIDSYGRDYTLNKVGAGTATSVSNFTYNSSGYAVNYDGNCYHKGSVVTTIGTNDYYTEFYASCKNSNLNMGVWALYDDVDKVVTCEFAASGQQLYVIMGSGGSYKVATWNIPYPPAGGDGTRHKFAIAVDRDSDANTKAWMDDTLLTKTTSTLDDHSGVNFNGTNLYIGNRGLGGSGSWDGELSQVKIVIGAYSGSTTPAFNLGITQETGTSAPAFTRATLQSSINSRRNGSSGYSGLNLISYPAHQMNDSANEDASGYLSESAATNAALRSRDLDTGAVWSTANITVTANQVDGPDGVNKAEKLVSTAANGTILQATGVTAVNKKYTNSFWMRAHSGTFTSSDVVIRVDDSVKGTEQVHGLYDADTGLEITAANGNAIGTTWRRVFMYNSFTNDAGLGFAVIGIKMITDALTIYVDMAQCEEVAATKHPSTFMETITTTVTRNLTSMTLNVAELSTVYSILCMWQPNTTAGNIIGEISPFAINSDIGVTRLYFDASDHLHFVYYGTDVDMGAKSWTGGDWICCGVIIDTVLDKFWPVWDGTVLAEQSVAKGTPTHASFYIGNDDGGAVGACGTIAQFNIYKSSRLVQAQVTTEYNTMKTAMGL